MLLKWRLKKEVFTIKGKLLTFYLNNQLYGIDITAVKEINRNIDYTIVPGAPQHIIGLFNMRGQIVTLFDLSGMLGYKRVYENKKASCIILKNTPAEPDYTGFLIAYPGSVVDVNEDMCEPPPANAKNIDNNYITEVVKIPGELITVINKQAILNDI